MTSEEPSPGYRPCVGIMLLNRAGKVFVARRSDQGGGAWQMPQGGIDPGETPATAALRELHEEIGTDRAEIIAEYEGWLDYDLPAEIADRLWGGKYRGQSQKWFVLRFTGQDSDIDLDTDHPEFVDWRWVKVEKLPDLIIEFKRPIYQILVERFRHLVKDAKPNR